MDKPGLGSAKVGSQPDMLDPSAYIRAARLGLFVPRYEPSNPDGRAWPWVQQDGETDLRGVIDALGRSKYHQEASVVTVSRVVARRPVFLIDLDDGKSLLLKWLSDTDGYPPNEVVLHQIISEESRSSRLRKAVPRLLDYDPAQGLLIFEGLRGASTLRQLVESGRAPSDAILIHFAAVLAALHETSISAARERYPDRRLLPPIQPMTDLTPSELARGPGLQYADYVAAVQAVDRELQALCIDWSPTALIHFDARDDNILIKQGSSHDTIPVFLVDWELAGFGDPAYDVGTVIGQLIYHALRNLTVDQAAELVIPRRGVSLFIRSYTQLAGNPPVDLPVRAVRYAGIFLLMRALATLQVAGALGPAGKLCLLLGPRFIAHPAVSAEQVLL